LTAVLVARTLVLVEPTSTVRPKASDYQASDFDRRRAVYNSDKHIEECFLCGRGLTAKALVNGWWIHLGTDGTLLTQDDPAAIADDTLSQGCFPVGSECAKRIDRPYKFKSTALATLVTR
jgi:hypothetical protein